MKKLKMYVSPEDRAEIYEIAIICDQWNILQGFTGDDYMMLLMACHANHKIDLARLKLASHEVMVEEIENFNQSINVDTLKLEACWSAYVINKRDMMAVKTK